MLLCEEVADSWRDAQEQKADLEVQMRETEQQLQSLIRRPAELDPKIAQNQLDKAQVSILLFFMVFLQLCLLDRNIAPLFKPVHSHLGGK